MIALLADLIVVVARKVQRLHSTPHEIADFGSLDLLCVIVARFIDHVNRILKGQARKEIRIQVLRC